MALGQDTTLGISTIIIGVINIIINAVIICVLAISLIT